VFNQYRLVAVFLQVVAGKMKTLSHARNADVARFDPRCKGVQCRADPA